MQKHLPRSLLRIKKPHGLCGFWVRKVRMMVEAAGVEPASENMFLGISPSAVSLFIFPSVVTKDKGERSVAS